MSCDFSTIPACAQASIRNAVAGACGNANDLVCGCSKQAQIQSAATSPVLAACGSDPLALGQVVPALGALCVACITGGQTSSPPPPASSSSSTSSSTFSTSTSTSPPAKDPTQSPPPPLQDNSSGTTSSSPGAGTIAGISVGVIALLVFFSGLLFLFTRRRKKSVPEDSPSSPFPDPAPHADGTPVSELTGGVYKKRASGPLLYSPSRIHEVEAREHPAHPANPTSPPNIPELPAWEVQRGTGTGRYRTERSGTGRSGTGRSRASAPSSATLTPSPVPLSLVPGKEAGSSSARVAESQRELQDLQKRKDDVFARKGVLLELQYLQDEEEKIRQRIQDLQRHESLGGRKGR